MAIFVKFNRMIRKHVLHNIFNDFHKLMSQTKTNDGMNN